MIFATCMLNVVMSCSNDCSVPRMRRGTCWRRSTDCPCTRTIRPSVSRKCRRRLPPDSSPALWTLLPTTTSWTPARQAGLCSGQVCSVSTRQSFHKVVLKYPKPTLMITKTNTDDNESIFKSASFVIVYLGHVALQVLVYV